LCFSISTVGTPKAAAAAATDRPPEPAPITQMSGVRISATFFRIVLELLPATIT